MDNFFAVPTRLELATSGVTGRYSNQLNYSTFVEMASATDLLAQMKRFGISSLRFVTLACSESGTED